MSRHEHWPWGRHLALAAVSAGILVSGPLDPPPRAAPLLALCAVAGILASRSSRPPPVARVACLAGLGALAGLLAGEERRLAIDRGALLGPAGAHVRAEGFVGAVPRRSRGEVRMPLITSDGRVVVVAREPVPRLGIGARIAVRGRLAEPDSWRAAELRRLGARLELRAPPSGIRSLSGGRRGLDGALDRIRSRAERALSAGLDPGRAALARGFVLGQDDLIDPGVREDFKRSGLAHLLAVSGQNVMLLAILAGGLLAVAGVRLRPRLILILLAIAVYVPVAGAGPSIQRAGIMGAAGVIAALASRPTDRAYPLLLAAAGTLLLNPHAAGDVGWQLSFAAVLGITLAAAPLRELLLRRRPAWIPPALGRPLAEGAALTVAATVATAPLMAHHFDAVPLASLPANLLALPAVAPVMWLGMLAAIAAQVPFVPQAVLTALGHLGGVGIGFIADVADVLGRPSWALAEVSIPGPAGIGIAYAAIGALAVVALAAVRRRRGLTWSGRVRLGAVLGGLALALLLAGPVASPTSSGPVAPGVLRVTALDVGQGDAVLLETARGDPILVDGGPPGGGVTDRLRELGVDRLRAVLLTHDDLDHAGGVIDLLGRIPVRTVAFARPAPSVAAAARAAGARLARPHEGSSIRAGRLQLDVLWPPRGPPGPLADRNALSVVLAARLGGYTALLTGDAEQEQTHLDPGPIDLLKVAHHGSEDGGLDALLDQSAPRAALISAGDGNRYGHPAAATTAALAERGICVLRTDLDGTVSVEVGARGLTIPSPATAAGRPGCGHDR